MFDLLIKNSLIIDGSGEEPYFSNIFIKGDKISQISANYEKANYEIDARGLVASPGFIDVHSHTDLTVFLYPSSERALRQGITTEVVGNCGLSSIPLTENNNEYWKKYMNFLGQNENYDLDVEWKSYSDFIDRLSSIRIGTNLACLIGHNTLRSSIMGIEGEGGERRSPSEFELREMKKELDACFKAGAFGLSTGLGYPVGRNCHTWEIIELCQITADNKAVYASHIRSMPNLDGYKEFFETIEKTNVKGIISHVRGRTKSYPKTFDMNPNTNINEIISLFQGCRKKGYDIYMDVIPFPSGLNSLASLLFGGWGLSEIETGFDEKGKLISMDGLLENLKNSDKCKYIKKRISKNPYVKLSTEKDTRMIQYSSENDQLVGKTVKEISEMMNIDELNTIIKILLFSNGDTRWGNVCIEKDIETLFINSDAIPSTDGYSLPVLSKTRTIGGIPGPRIFGTFPYFIHKYRKRIPLEDIIYRLTNKPAQVFNIEKRGLLKPSYFADLVLFNPETIRNLSSYQNPNALPEGINMIIQNGQISLYKNALVSLEGKVLKRECN